MALIMLNFMRAGSMVGHWDQREALLHLPTAQSLWIAFPAYWQSRNS